MEEIVRAITVVTPCFNEELNVQECYEAVRNLFANELAAYRREHIFCDNASTDGTLAILRKIAAADRSVKIIVNRRNFGPLKNTYNGVMASSGNAVLLFLPADLQDPPDLLPQFVKYWEEGWLMRNLRNAYYRVLTRFSEVKVPPGVGDFQLVDRRVVETMREVRDGYPFIRMMTFECGGRAIGVPYTWRARKRGLSKNRFSALIDQAINGLVSFTSAPLRLGFMVGFFLSVLSIGYAIINLVLGLILYRRIAEPGIITIIVALFFFGGVQLFFMGMIGEYILAIHGQVRTKPVVFERERINFETPDGSVQEAAPVGAVDPATPSR
jgi:glycosyltransferase involved in cell wall biosynthesis